MNRWKALVLSVRLPQSLNFLNDTGNSSPCISKRSPHITPSSCITIPSDLYRVLDSWSLFSRQQAKADNTKVPHQFYLAPLSLPRATTFFSPNSSPEDAVHFLVVFVQWIHKEPNKTHVVKLLKKSLHFTTKGRDPLWLLSGQTWIDVNGTLKIAGYES